MKSKLWLPKKSTDLEGTNKSYYPSGTNSLLRIISVSKNVSENNENTHQINNIKTIKKGSEDKNNFFSSS